MAGETREHAERHAHQKRDPRRDARDLDRHREPPRELGGHGLLRDQRDAEIALDGAPQPHAELLDDGPVQPVPRGDLIAQLLRRLRDQHILETAGKGVDRPENENGDAEQGEARAGNTYQRVPRHCRHEGGRLAGGGYWTRVYSSTPRSVFTYPSVWTMLALILSLRKATVSCRVTSGTLTATSSILLQSA